MPASVITLTTDFGQADGYVGTMKGVIFSRAPQAQIIDLSHEIAPQDVASGAFILYRAYPYFPPQTIHVAVIDPGVGTARRALLLVTDQGRFVGPDNGLFSYVLRQAVSLAARWTGTPAHVPAIWHPDFDMAATRATLPKDRLPAAYALTNASYWLEGAGATFQGRDVFAPVAAHLANGVAPTDLGQVIPLEELVMLPAAAPRRAPGALEGRVISVDHFGNLITNIAAGLLSGVGPMETLFVTLGALRLRGIHATYGTAPPGTALALINSAGLLEIAIRNGSAARQLGGQSGDQVSVAAQEK
jgi:S-adenosylmethionine hydrolase